MFKKVISLVAMGIISMSLVACGNSTEKESASGSDTTQEQGKTNESNENKGNVYEVEGATTDESNIVQTIKEVSIFDNMEDAIKSFGQSDLVVNEDNKDKVTVVVKFDIKNNNDFMIYTYPAQATFITNTGEQVEADLMASESFDGDIHEGVNQEGHVVFNLNKTAIDDLESFKMAWSTSHENGTTENYDDDYYKDNKLEVKLK